MWLKVAVGWIFPIDEFGLFKFMNRDISPLMAWSYEAYLLLGVILSRPVPQLVPLLSVLTAFWATCLYEKSMPGPGDRRT